MRTHTEAVKSHCSLLTDIVTCTELLHVPHLGDTMGPTDKMTTMLLPLTDWLQLPTMTQGNMRGNALKCIKSGDPAHLQNVAMISKSKELGVRVTGQTHTCIVAHF